MSLYVLPGKRAFCDCILFLSQSRDGCTSKLKRRDMNVFVVQSNRLHDGHVKVKKKLT